MGLFWAERETRKNKSTTGTIFIFVLFERGRGLSKFGYFIMKFKQVNDIVRI